jgi:hypothetical protein
LGGSLFILIACSLLLLLLLLVVVTSSAGTAPALAELVATDGLVDELGSCCVAQ